MIKKMVLGSVLIVMGVFLVFFQLNAIDQLKEKDEMIKVYRLSENMTYGDQLKMSNLDELYIRKTDDKDQYLKKLDNNIYYIISDIKMDSILIKNDVSLEKPLDAFLENDKNNIITLELGIEEANAWNFKEFDSVDLYFVSNTADKENIIYEDITVYKIINSNPFRDDYSESKSPQYVSLLVDKEKSYEILSNKKQGRFEIILN